MHSFSDDDGLISVVAVFSSHCPPLRRSETFARDLGSKRAQATKYEPTMSAYKLRAVYAVYGRRVRSA